MQYKEFGNTGIRVSRLGFGAMRLPWATDENGSRVDYDKAVPIIHRAFELGINYIDTCWNYGNATSEICVGKALKGWRDKVYLSTKCPLGRVEKPSDFRRELEQSLTKLQTDYIDFYHFHGISLGGGFTSKILGLNLFEEVAKAKEEGLIRFMSFSFHDKPENMRPIIDSGQFATVLCQYNLLDRSNEESMAYAVEHGLGVAIMGPVGGGRLGYPSEMLTELAKGAHSTAESALRFVLANPNVTIALSGMNTIQMVEENVATASLEEPLSEEERVAINEVTARNVELAKLYCTGCRYCLPCPNGINIPSNFELMNLHRIYGLTDAARAEYKQLMKKNTHAAACIECGQCETKCPQKIKIIDQLKDVAALMDAS